MSYSIKVMRDEMLQILITRAAILEKMPSRAAELSQTRARINRALLSLR